MGIVYATCIFGLSTNDRASLQGQGQKVGLVGINLPQWNTYSDKDLVQKEQSRVYRTWKNTRVKPVAEKRWGMSALDCAECHWLQIMGEIGTCGSKK